MTRARTVLKISMKPIAGSLIQPTGFPDLGACTFGDGKLLVESVQSMANWLESTTWDVARSEPTAEVATLPYVRVVDKAGESGEYLTSSRVEAHRLASAYIMNGKIDDVEGRKWFLEKLGLVRGKPLDYQAVARACFRLDPVSLVHGVFFAQKEWPWQPKVARALTSFIEASGVTPAVSGGVKRDSVYNEVAPGDTTKGYGSVPHHRVEYSYESITAWFTIDRAQLRSYGLSEPATALLEALADFEIASLLDNGLRLRTRCDLDVDQVEEGERPDAVEAAQRIAKFAADCKDELGEVTTVVYAGRGK